LRRPETSNWSIAQYLEMARRKPHVGGARRHVAAQCVELVGQPAGDVPSQATAEGAPSATMPPTTDDQAPGGRSGAQVRKPVRKGRGTAAQAMPRLQARFANSDTYPDATFTLRLAWASEGYEEKGSVPP
jgi:hypothetical protein